VCVCVVWGECRGRGQILILSLLYPLVTALFWGSSLS
jgi:hypothetical protein